MPRIPRRTGAGRRTRATGVRAVAVVLCALVACAVGASGQSLPPSPAADSVDHAIYDAVLDAHVFDEERTAAGYVLTDSTFGIPPASLDAEDRADPDFRARNRRRVAVQASRLRSRAVAGMFPAAALFNPGPDWNRERFWEGFGARFPGAHGPIALTRPGFTPDGTHALVYVAEFAGGMGGRVGYLLLERRDGRWTVLQSRILMEA
jgi:hypothetical protein